MNKGQLTIHNLKEIYAKKNYAWSNRFMIIGVRTLDKTPDCYNDFICVIVDNSLVGIYGATTDTGLFYLNNPMNINGTFVLQEGQHINMWHLGLHKGYEALIQRIAVKGWRDNNKDSTIDYEGITFTDSEGVNLHRSHETWTSRLLKIMQIKVGKYSAGCQVLAFKDNFDEFMKFAKESQRKTFTYTLLSEIDFN